MIGGVSDRARMLKRRLASGIGRLRRSGPAAAAVALSEYLRWKFHETVRWRYYHRPVADTAQEVGPGLWVGGETSVNSETVLGRNVHFMGMEVRGDGPLTIGDNFHSGSGRDIITAHHNYDDGDAIPYDGTYVRDPVEIGDNVWFGIDVTVVPGVSIGEGAVIQPGSVVVRDVPKGGVAGGHPAEVFARRDMNHHEELKAAGRFH